MSGYRGHLLAYLVMVVVSLTIAQRYYPLDIGITKTLVGIAIGALYSLLPDIDTPSSKMRRIVGRLFLAMILASLIVYLGYPSFELIYISIILAFFLYVLWFVKHRGILHTPLVAIILSSPLYLLELWYAGFAFAGFMSHLVLDREVFR